MAALNEYTSDFDVGAREQGRELFRQKAARIDESNGRWLKARVLGKQWYDVQIDLDPDDGATYACNCADFQETEEPCRHCWATLLQANQTNVLPTFQSAEAYVEEHGGRDDVVEFDEAEDEADDDDGLPPLPPPPPRNPTRGAPLGAREPNAAAAQAWKKQLTRLTQAMKARPAGQGYGAAFANHPPALAWPAGRRVVYVIDKPGSMEGRGLVLELAHETPKKDGSYDRPKQLKIGREQIQFLPDETDRQIVQMLLGARRGDYGYYGYYDAESPRRFELPESAYRTTLRLMCETGRARLRRETGDDHPKPIAWDDGPPWEFWLALVPSPGGRYLTLEGSLRRTLPGVDGGEPVAERQSIAEPDLLVNGGLVFSHGKVAGLDHRDAFDLIIGLREGLKLTVPLDQRDELMKTLFALPRLPRLDLPDDLQVMEISPDPKPRLTVRKPARTGGYSYDERLTASVSFDYDGHNVTSTDEGNTIFASDGRKLIHRDTALEAQAIARLYALGLRDGWEYTSGYNSRQVLRLVPSKLPKVVAELTREGWHVEAEGKLYRQPGEFKVNVSSGIDWFELHGEVSFGDQTASLPKLLEALRRGENSIKLDDGTFGLLPQDWLKKYAPLVGLGEATEDHLRFTKRQVGFLDALLSQMPEARSDETFNRARDELMRFDGIKPLNPPVEFQGELRAYQKDGLGWMSFLRKFGFGGCLADDMGLGKTVQVLALLENRRQLRMAGANAPVATNGSNGNGDGHAAPEKIAGPSLVVAPRSLVFNWKAEAARFTPDLRVLDHTSVTREKGTSHFENYDLILTTYGTLRRDMGYFKDVRFDYAVLDEAQAIKNAASESAKAARLINADHRLALSGTPVQNHLGELWSLFEYLNPGMMGTATVFKTIGAGSNGADADSRVALSKALRPFILRRTKEQVAKDLPDKTEQTIFCELDTTQRKNYNELRDHYRGALLERIAKEGMNKAKIMVLEALLRLRQAACHPGLIDKKRTNEGSAKLDALLARIAEVIDEGHKVLVFSQFTSFLAIVRDRLDADKTVYEYLDGRTKDRQARVERFQSDESCKLFLISLKAGGLGLNLTAADYVFLLDPWWNPAVEAQAIDRAYRIGQTKNVFAYRLIAKDTVEEKVLQLQQTKKELADAIINADNSLIRSLNRDDLELLLS